LTPLTALPDDTAAFTGRRAELDRIAEAGTGRVVAIHAVGGRPGVGTTTLAVRAAHLAARRFPDGRLFVDLRGPADPCHVLATLLNAVGVRGRYLPGNLDGRIALWRDRMAGRRALLILDDAAGYGQVAPLLPGAPGCLVLVTGRRPRDGPAAVSLPLDVLTAEDSIRLFARLAPEGAPAEVVRLCGGLPLAISLLARLFGRLPGADGLIERWAGSEEPARAAFELCYRSLPGGRRCFLRLVGVHPGPSIDVHAAAAAADVPADEAAQQLSALARDGLLTEPVRGRYRFHDLIREYAARPPAAAARARLFDHYRRTAEAAGQEWLTSERPNVLACVEDARGRGEHARVVGLAAAIADHLRTEGPWAEAVALHSAAVVAARSLGVPAGYARALSDLGEARHRAGDYAGAVAALEQALAVHRRGDSLDDRAEEATVLGRLAMARRLRGDRRGAAAAAGDALAIHRDLGDRPGQARDLNLLATVRYAAGDHHEAGDALKEALDIDRDLGDRLGRARDLNLLGAVRYATGDREGAVAALEEALGIHRGLGNRLGEVNVLGVLEGVRYLTGDHDGAAAALEEALSIHRSAGDRLGEVESLNHTGGLELARGHRRRALTRFRRALEIARAIRDEPGERRALDGIGRCLRG
jgi:tetratricopeptide (TPR) repeat protein